jgi:hypothetical protein
LEQRKLINFRKGSKDEFAKLPEEAEFEQRAEVIRRHLAEIFGSKNLSFLIGSGCSSFKPGEEELGIPTMGPLAQEFQNTLKTLPAMPPATSYVTSAQKSELLDKLGIDLAHPDFHMNLERLMEVLMTAQQFCKTSKKADLKSALTNVDEVIAGVKKFVLQNALKATSLRVTIALCHSTAASTSRCRRDLVVSLLLGFSQLITTYSTSGRWTDPAFPIPMALQELSSAVSIRPLIGGH